MMAAIAHDVEASVVPVLRYRNLPAAIDWLCRAFAFEKHYVVAGKSGSARFAQLTFGNAMIMLGSVQESAFDKLMTQPDEIGGVETQTCYFFVADAHAHCARAKAAGAAVIFDIEDKVNGGRSYSCRDPEGHIWNFGTYNPWQRQPLQGLPRSRRRSVFGGRPMRVAVGAGLSCLALAAVVAAGCVPDALQQTVREIVGVAAPPSKADASETLELLTQERRAREAAERASKDAHEQLRELRGRMAFASQAAGEARNRQVDAERAAAEARNRLATALSEKEAAERAAEDARARLVGAQKGRELAQRAAREARQQLARERSVRKSEGEQPAASAAPMGGWQ
jgi:uncharacterized glyoxalase superfamily protein PhnB